MDLRKEIQAALNNCQPNTNRVDKMVAIAEKYAEYKQSLQLLQPDVSTSFPNQCKCIGNAGTNCFTGNCTVCGKRK